MKRLSTLLAATAIALATMAQSAGDYVYTDNGRFKIRTGKNLMANGDFTEGMAQWTTDGGKPLSVDTFGIEIENGNNYLTVYQKDNGPAIGTGSSLMRKIPVYHGYNYVITYQVRGESEEIATTVDPAGNKNYQNFFFSSNGSLTPDENGAIAKMQTYGWDWKTINYNYLPTTDGYIMMHFYAPYVGTAFDNFAVMEADEVIDDREANKVIAELQTYIDNPLFSNGKEMMEAVISDIRGYMEKDDLMAYKDMMLYIDDLISEFLDMNTANITDYLPNGNFDNLAPSGSNIRNAGAWTIDDLTPANGKTRWAIKDSYDTGAPFKGLYLQDDVPGPYLLREACVHQTMRDMPAAQYMFTVKARAGYQDKNNVFKNDFIVEGLKVFINGDSVDCAPINNEKPERYTVYSRINEQSDIKLGFFVTDSVCNHIDFDVVDIRIIGWTAEQAEEYFLQKQLAETREALKCVIDSATVLIGNAELLYGKAELTMAVATAQGVYDNGSENEEIEEAITALKESITAYHSANAVLTSFRNAIANAESILEKNLSEEAKQLLQEAIKAAKTYLGTLTAENHETEGFTNDDIREQTALLNKAVNVAIASIRKADEKLEYLIWAQQDGASFLSEFIYSNEIISSSGSTMYAEGGLFAGHDISNRMAFIEGLTISLNTSHGMEVLLPSKNKTSMAILDLKQGDRVEMDWAMGNSSHNVMVSSANARVRLADGKWKEYTVAGKHDNNVVPKDNKNGFSGSTSTTFEMTADGTLDFFQSSSASTLRIYYIGITRAENVVDDGIDNINTTTHTATGAIYDLQGRKLDSVPAKGIYIRDGKKIVVK